MVVTFVWLALPFFQLQNSQGISRKINSNFDPIVFNFDQNAPDAPDAPLVRNAPSAPRENII